MKFSLIIFILKLLLIVNVVSISEVECNPHQQVSECEQQKLKLQTEITSLKLEILKLREENQILLNEVNCTELSDSVDNISSSLKTIQLVLDPIKNRFRERGFNLNRKDIETNQTKFNIENHIILSELKENLTAIGSRVVSESLEPLLRELKTNNERQQKPIQSCAQTGKFGVIEVQIPFTNKPIEVFCEENNWLTVLRRVDGDVYFDRPWQDYKVGFGNIAGNFFLGLENIYQLTAHQCHELMVILKDFDDVEKYANYNHFRIGSEAEDYSLNVLGNYSGTAGDAFRVSESMKFTTYDRDNDKRTFENCALTYHGGWWHNSCGESKLTGVYQPYRTDVYWAGIEWQTWHNRYSFKYAKMMVRPTTC